MLMPDTEHKITQKEVRRLFSYNKNTGILKWKVSLSNAKGAKIGDIAGSLHKEGYLQIGINNKTYKAHRLIWLGFYGYMPEGLIDHKDRIRSHNWILNLREASKQCNIRNSENRKDNTSGIKGVSWCNTFKKWRTGLALNGKLNHIGYYKDFDEAVCARLAIEQCVDWAGCDSSSPAYQYVKESIN